ncbi:MAG: hypothetical protein CMH13_07490 [Martelella sp.]|nr:hypothetical protein [Martelella sp.]
MHGSCIKLAQLFLPKTGIWTSHKKSGARSSIAYHEETPMNPFDLTMKWFSYRRTRAQLRNLSAEELKDIGLLPSDIDRVSARAFR